MKKLLVVLLALTALGGAVFAQDGPVWTWSAVLNTGAQIKLGDSTSVPSPTIELYNADAPNLTRFRFNGAVALGDFGINFRIAADPPDFNTLTAPIPTLNYAWVTAKFFEQMVQVRAGDINNQVSDTVNNGFGGLNVVGLQLVVAPMSGLSVGLSLPLQNAAAGTFGSPAAGNIDLNAALAGIKVGAAYTMTDLVTVKGTWMNAGGTNQNDAAFGVAVLAVPNLTAEFEVNVTNLSGTAAGDSIELFQNVAYAMGPLKPGLTVDETLYGQSGLNTQIWVKPSVDYLVMEGTNVGASVKYTMNSAGGSTSGLVVDPYVKLTFSPQAALKIDAAYTIADLSATSTWTLPININFLFSF